MSQRPSHSVRAPGFPPRLRAGAGGRPGLLRRVPCATLVLLAFTGCAGLRGPVPEPAVQRVEAEDDHVQVSELKVRGQVQRITVTPKDGQAPRYEITPPAAGSDPSQHRDGTGRRVWQILSF